MPDPIRPEDHKIGSQEIDARFAFIEWQMDALAEAIHQTFERDAKNARRIRCVDGPTPDPDTEIDRLARLIVDGEYRRRAKETTND